MLETDKSRHCMTEETNWASCSKPVTKQILPPQYVINSSQGSRANHSHCSSTLSSKGKSIWQMKLEAGSVHTRWSIAIRYPISTALSLKTQRFKQTWRVAVPCSGSVSVLYPTTAFNPINNLPIKSELRFSCVPTNLMVWATHLVWSYANSFSALTKKEVKTKPKTNL